MRAELPNEPRLGPPVPVVPGGVRASRDRRYGDLGGRSTFVIVMLAISALAEVMVMAFTLAEVSLIDAAGSGSSATMTDIYANYDRLATWEGLHLVALIVTVVAWCVWQHRAQRNLTALGQAGLDYSPRWAVGWWFVPFANLVKPFQTVRELWKASGRDARPWRAIPTPPLIGWWWATWILSGVIDAFSGTRNETTPLSTIRAGDVASLIASVIAIACAFLAVTIVRQVRRRQADRATWYAGDAGPVAIPAPPIPPPPAPLP